MSPQDMACMFVTPASGIVQAFIGQGRFLKIERQLHKNEDGMSLGNEGLGVLAPAQPIQHLRSSLNDVTILLPGPCHKYNLGHHYTWLCEQTRREVGDIVVYQCRYFT